MKIKYVIALLASITILGFGVLNVNANSLELPFSVSLITPDSQDEGVDNYVSITTDELNVKEKLQFSLINNGNSTREIIVEVVDGYTAPSGVVQYSAIAPSNSEITDESYKLSNYVTVESSEASSSIIKLEANEEKTVTLNLNVEEVEGTLLGGVLFKENVEKTENGDDNLSIESEVNMVIGIKVDFGTEQLVSLDIGKPFVDAMPTLHVIRLPMEIVTPVPKKVIFDYSVEQNGEELFSNLREVDLAPMAKVNVRIPWETESIETKQDYTLKGTMSYTDLDGQTKEIQVDKVFQYKTESTAKQVFNKLMAPIEEGGLNLTWVLYVLLGMVILTPLPFIIVSKKRRYSHYSNKLVVSDLVVAGDELYSKMTKSKSLADGNRYRHIYKRKDNIYRFIKTKELKVK